MAGAASTGRESRHDRGSQPGPAYAAAGQHQQRPAPREGGLFDRRKFKEVPASPAGGEWVRAWDFAGTTKKKSAWTVGLLMQRVNDEYYIHAVERFKGAPIDVENALVNIAAQDGHETKIDFPRDPGQAGEMQAQHFVKKLPGYNARYSPETGSKVTRAEPLSAQVAAGNVYLVGENQAWHKVLLDEYELFPNTDYADQVDAGSRAFHSLIEPRYLAGPGAKLFMAD